MKKILSNKRISTNEAMNACNQDTNITNTDQPKTDKRKFLV